MSDITGAIKRVLVGRPVRSDSLGHTLLPKRLALPVFASDALSSVAYAPDEVLLTLSFAGLAATALSPWVGLAVVVVMLTVVASYRQVVRAYPSGGGDYQVATENISPNAGLAVASALLADYSLTVAVSVSSGVQYLISAVSFLEPYHTPLAVGIVCLVALANLRGVRESGRFFAVPVYGFMAAIGVMAIFGAFQLLTGTLQPAESAAFSITPDAAHAAGLSGVAGAFLVLRAFSSGSAALTGIEAIANGVPAFKKPKSKNAATTLLILGVIAVTMLMSITVLARQTGVRYVENPAKDLTLGGGPIPDSYFQQPVIGQVAGSVFHSVPVLFYFTAVVTGIILMLAANTAFNGFPVLGSVLARDGYLPKQLHTRGDRLAFSNGIVVLALGAIILILAFDASVTRLIQLYIVGVFFSFTVSQWGMVQHWNGELRTESSPVKRRQIQRSRAINLFGFFLTAVVLVVVVITKFTHGAWITLTVMAVLFVTMRAIRRHYDTVAKELALAEDTAKERALPSRVHAIVLLSKLHRPAMRAIAYARATRPNTLEAVVVSIEPDEVDQLRRDFERTGLPVPLKILDSPFREITRPVLDYVRSIRLDSPRDLVVVYIPEYVVGHWWEQVLHNQTALRLKSRLLFTRGVVVASVPWQLSSTQGRDPQETWRRPKRTPFDAAPPPGSDAT